MESWSGVRERPSPASGTRRPCGRAMLTHGSARTEASVREGRRVPGGGWRNSHRHEIMGIGRGQRGRDLAREIPVGAKTAYCLADLS